MDFKSLLSSHAKLSGSAQEMEDLQNILESRLYVGLLIFQHQDEKHLIKTTVGRLEPKSQSFAASYRNQDGTVDIHMACQVYDTHTDGNPDYQARLPPIHRLRHRSRFLDDAGVANCCNPYNSSHKDGEQLKAILEALIESGITNPICRRVVFCAADVDCWHEKLPSDTKVNLRIIHDQIDNFPQAKIVNSLSDCEQIKGIVEDVARYHAALDYKRAHEKKGSINEQHAISYDPQFWQRSSADYEKLIQVLKLTVDEYLFANAIDMSHASAYSAYFGRAFQFPPDRRMHQLKPIRSNPPISTEDRNLRAAFAKIKQDLYYSRRKKTIYSLKQVQQMFDKELEIYMLDPTFKKHCKHMQILNVHVYIFEPEIDALFTTADFRANQAAICKLTARDSKIGIFSMISLLGFSDVKGAVAPEEKTNSQGVAQRFPLEISPPAQQMDETPAAMIGPSPRPAHKKSRFFCC